MPETIERVSFIGLGRMGAGIARNILKAGFTLTVYNRTPAKMQPLIDQGATGANSPREAAVSADVVLTSLMDDQSLLDSVSGAHGVLAGLKAGAALAHGMAHKDWSAVYEITRMNAGLE